MGFESRIGNGYRSITPLFNQIDFLKDVEKLETDVKTQSITPAFVKQLLSETKGLKKQTEALFSEKQLDSKPNATKLSESLQKIEATVKELKPSNSLDSNQSTLQRIATEINIMRKVITTTQYGSFDTFRRK